MAEDEPYRVAIKASAWRTCGRVGEWVNRNGPTRTFPSRALAREWARECATPATRVWVQDAVPWDASDADGYLVGTSRHRGGRDPRPGGSQATLETAGADTAPPE